jgi:LysM repeat protein
MKHPSDEDRARSYQQAPRGRRRYSPWTIIAPAAAIILWISFFSALGHSCIFKECSDTKDASAETTRSDGDKANDLPRGAKAKVKTGDSLGAIAARFDLTEEELKACNPLVDPQALQPNQFLIVSAVDCEEADKADTGANPDPLAGETSAADNAAVNNGTAAADPSAQADAPEKTETAADQGDEG